MRIVGSQIQALSQHQFQRAEQHVSVRQQLAAPTSTTIASTDTKTSSHQPDADEVSFDKQLSLLKALVEKLTGHKIQTVKINSNAAATTAAPNDARAPTPAPASGPVLRIDTNQVSETETTNVAFTGQIDTADGSHISLDLQFFLDRSYASTSVSTNVVNGKVTDPLVLNFDGAGAKLTKQSTAFDLNSDGKAESIPTLATGSAYLALDRNGDGAINNGAELFGPQSGNGYAELAKLDQDGNGFIDSGDSVFGKLVLYRPGEQPQTLASRDIGAIYLGNVDSPARLTDSSNNSLGQLRATGFYLTNQGSAGLVQQLDLAV